MEPESHKSDSVEFSLNVLTEFAELSGQNVCLKGIFETAASCVRDQSIKTLPIRQCNKGGL